MAKRTRRSDPIEADIEVALQPGDFIPDRGCWEFVSDLEKIAAKISKLISDEPARAEALFETFLAGCYEKAEEVDDSSGSFGQFVGSLFCSWIKARRSAGKDPLETARSLLTRMSDDPHGFCYKLEHDVAKAFDNAGLAAFEQEVRARFEASFASGADTPEARNANYARRRAVEMLKAIYVTRRTADAYIELCEKTATSPDDCVAIAEVLRGRQRREEALAWVDRGLALERSGRLASSSGRLEDMKRDLLEKLGRGHEALDSAWAQFVAHPSHYTHRELLKYVPKKERATWRKKAMDASEKGELRSVVELWLEVGELERLVGRLRSASNQELEALSHYTTEPAAQRLSKTHPDVAAKLHRAMGLRILNSKKSKYYEAALKNFAEAKRLYSKAGEEGEWLALVAQVRRDHARKLGIMDGFERLVAGEGPAAKPSFLDRARARWGQGKDGQP